jgi:hypothetical protein
MVFTLLELALSHMTSLLAWSLPSITACGPCANPAKAGCLKTLTIKQQSSDDDFTNKQANQRL